MVQIQTADLSIVPLERDTYQWDTIQSKQSSQATNIFLLNKTIAKQVKSRRTILLI